MVSGETLWSQIKHKPNTIKIGSLHCPPMRLDQYFETFLCLNGLIWVSEGVCLQNSFIKVSEE